MGRKTDLNTLNVTNALTIIASRNVQHSRDGGRGACRWPHRFPSPPHMARWHHQPVLMEKGGQEVSTPQAGGVWAEVVPFPGLAHWTAQAILHPVFIPGCGCSWTPHGESGRPPSAWAPEWLHAAASTPLSLPHLHQFDLMWVKSNCEL